MKHSYRKLVSSVLAIFALVLIGIAGPAVAAPAPTGGPTTGGTPVTIQGIRFIKIVSGDNHSVGLTSEGTVYAWGRNDFGQLGNGTTANSNTPVQVVGVGGTGFLTGVTEIAAGAWHTLVSTSTGVYAWGNNDSGRLGDGTTTNRLTPVQVVGVGGTGTLGPATALAGGYFHSLAISGNNVYAWGSNGWGQLGNNSQVNSSSPVVVKNVDNTGNLSGVTAISAGSRFSLALTADSVYAWGQNQSNQLGNDVVATTGLFRGLPVKVKNVAGTGDLTGATAIASGPNFSLALVNSGVVAWGENPYGQLGDNSTTQRARPVEVLNSSLTPLTGVTAIAAGGNHSLALTSNGLMSWGLNGFGQLGDRSTLTRTTAVSVLRDASGTAPFTAATAISAGWCTSTTLTATDVYAFGCNVDYGGLGDGTNTSRWIPVLSANFRPASVTFGGIAGTSVAASGTNVSVVAPANTAGTVNVVGTMNVFGGVVAGSPSTATLNAGTYLYVGPPTITSNAPVVTSTSHTFTFTGGSGATFKCSTDNGVTYSSCSSPVSLTSLAQGAQTFDVYEENGGISGPVTRVTWSIDSVAPSVTFGALSTPRPAGDLIYTATFNEVVSGITPSDFSIPGSTSCSIGSVSNSGGGTIYTVTVTGCSAGDVVVLRLASGAGSDPAGNSGPSSAVSTSSVTLSASPTSTSSGTTGLPFTGMHLFGWTVALAFTSLIAGATIILIRRRRINGTDS